MKANHEIEELISGLQSKQLKEREEAFHQLYALSEEHPELLYPFWDRFAEMLHGPEVSKLYWAIHIIANLARVDTDNRFEELFDLWFNELLNHESPVVSPHAAEKSEKIVLAKPELEKRITPLLLDIANTSHCRHLDLQKAYVLSALDQYFDWVSDKEAVVAFIREQLQSTSPKTRKKAKELKQKYDIN
ncbi:hypothetical protein PbJCM13498_03380 [Prolixibacter bellariivorans]|uniref:DNA alkylation repair protein n=1 Tax=Prolixibacter bellariivorans TaxID=314319 RepID=A0A5M4AU61_9BACT|nr:hypothetical protein [Prolixibacter bellariivorans]GET31475.1 hypothetical protein PbJCM13498_03380 [Prolixibacter bellariivorans]